MPWGQLSTEDKVNQLWNKRNCAQICEVTDLPDNGVEGQVVRIGSLLYVHDGEGWIPVNEVSLPFELSGVSDKEDFYAQHPMKITSINYGSPGTADIYLNGALYTFGNLINTHDHIKVVGQGIVKGQLKGYRTTAEFFDIKVVTSVVKQSWAMSETDNIIIGLLNVGNAANTGVLTIRLIKADPNFTFTPNTTDTLVLADGVTYAVDNPSFTFAEQATRWNFTTNAGVYIQPGEALWISVPTEATGITGANSTFNVILVTSTGDMNVWNNSYISETISIV